MSALGFVVIEYNQASHWPSLWADTLYDTRAEASEFLRQAQAETLANGRGEKYAVASIELCEVSGE